jgi:hypothetical protein
VDRDALRDRVEAWTSSGIITREQADRIIELETRPETRVVPPAGRRGEDARDEAWPDARGERRLRVAEVVGYVGAAFALGAIGLLVGELWSDLAVWARVALAGLLTVTALGAGVLLNARPAAAIRRLVGVLWLAGIAGVAWTTGVVAWEVIGVREAWLPTTIGAVALIVAGVLLLVGGHVLVQLATLVALGATTTGTLVAIAPLEPGPLAYGAMLVGGGATWALAGAGRWLGPRVSAEVSGAVVMLIGAQVLTASSWPRPALVLAVVLAAVLVAVSLPGGRVHLLFVGAIGLFVSVPRLVFALFADTFGAPATLLTIGVLLIIMAVGLGRVRRAQEVRNG